MAMDPISRPDAPADGSVWGRYLDPGERLLWSGAPDGGLRCTGRDLIVSAFSLLLLGFAILWVAGAGAGLWSGEWRDHQGFLRWWMVLFPLFGLPFVLGGFYAVIGRYFTDAARRRRTVLALTDRRGLILAGGPRPMLTSFPIRPDTVIDYYPGRLARIHFATIGDKDSEGWTSYHRAGFDWIAGGEAVYRLIRRIQQGEG